MNKITHQKFLECIKEYKDVLFGGFLGQLTHQDVKKA